MSAKFELDSIMEQMLEFQKDINSTIEEEAIINGKIAALRLDIAKLRDRRTDTKRKLWKAQADKESLERKVKLEEEAALIQQSIDERRAEVEELIKNAPWINDAFDWQIEGAIRLPDRALLGDKRGLGKTLSSLIWRRVHKVKKTLVCLRREVAYDFIKEIGIREPKLFVYPLISATPEARKIAATLLAHHEEFVVVTNIESWRRSIDVTTEDILKIPYDGVILDEAHHIKNSATGTAQGFFRLAEEIPKVLELTGTPIKNRPQEMYSLLHALYPDLFISERKFLVDYCDTRGQNKWVFTEFGVKQLVQKINSFYLARSPEDVGRKVPPPRMITYDLDFDAHPEQKEAYKVITERNMAILNSGAVIPIMSQLAIMTRQAQVVSWPAGIEFKIADPFNPDIIEILKFDVHQSVKMDWAEELLQELVGEGERVVLFSRFKPAIYELKRRLELQGLSVAVITGDEKAKGNTQEIFDDFDLKTASKNPKYQVLLATYQTVGESANLNAATHMILYDRFWNPGNEDQAIGRIDRINSVTQATIHVPQVKDSIDIFMAELISDKRNLVMSFGDEATAQAKLSDHLRSTL